MQLFAFIAVLLVGAGLCLAYLLLGGRYRYLLSMGLGFVALAASLLPQFPGLVRLGLLAAAVIGFIVAIVDSIRASRVRLVEMRAEQFERETAFAEYLQALHPAPEHTAETANDDGPTT